MKRIITGLGIAAALVIAFVLRQVNLFCFDIFVGVLTVFASMEVAKLLHKAGKNNIIFADVLFPAIVYLWLLIGVASKMSLLNILLGVMVGLVSAILLTFVVLCCLKIKTKAMMNVSNYEGNRINFCLNSALSTGFGFVVPSFFLLIAILMNHISSFSAELSNLALFESIDIGLIILLAWIGTTVASDVCAFYVGTLFKGKKLCPSISPNKTISGAIGGVLGSIIFSLLAYLIVTAINNGEIATIFTSIGVNYFTVVVFGLVASLFTQAGDLFESALKRKADVKDSGNILPGHGGIMDRCDGLCFNSLWVFAFFLIVL